MDKKNTMLLTVVAVATLLVAVVGATFAFFTAQNSAAGTTNVTTTTETIGAVTVTNPTATMKIKLAAAHMQETVKGAEYWATATDADFVDKAEHVTVAQLNVDGGTETTKYVCEFTLTVTKPQLIKAGDMAIILTTEDVEDKTTVTIENVTSGEEMDLFGASSYKVTVNQTGDVVNKSLITAAVKLKNTTENQNYIAGETLLTSIANSGMSCTIAD